jgi:Septum formation
LKRLAAGITLVLGLSSCAFSGHDKPLWAISLRPGQCGDPVRTDTDEVARVQVKDCAEDHGIEVYALVTFQDAHRQSSSVPDAKYPGQEALVRFGREACAGRYRTYLGDAAPSPDQYLTFLYPSASSWTAYGAARPEIPLLESILGKSPQPNRNIVCVVQSAGAENFTGSVQSRNGALS